MKKLIILAGLLLVMAHTAFAEQRRVFMEFNLKVGSINSIFYFLHKAAEPFNCLEQDNLA